MTSYFIQRAFNKAHHTYDHHSQLQQTIGLQLIHMLRSFPFHNTPRIIDLGCGTGWITEKLAHTYHDADLHALDFAENLLHKANERLARYAIHLHHADFNALPESDFPFDIIFSNMALHWSPNLFSTLQSLIAHLSNHGVLAFSLPLAGTFRELQPHFAVNKFYDAATLAQDLDACGYEIAIAHTETHVRTFNNTLSALKSIQQVGANVTERNVNHLRGKTHFKQLQLHSLTYRIGYFIATKSGDPCRKNILLPAQALTLEKPTLVCDY